MLWPFTTLDYFSPSSLKDDPGSFEAQAIQLPNPSVLSVNLVPGLPSTPAPSQNFSSLVAKEPTPHLSVSAPFPLGPLSTPPVTQSQDSRCHPQKVPGHRLLSLSLPARTTSWGSSTPFDLILPRLTASSHCGVHFRGPQHVPVTQHNAGLLSLPSSLGPSV